ncbi:MAG: hypothetical protein XXXJIFNMEKO3_02242 [Candidatus Erwinia impunctatus]|nr:hypothetical protein XXXJIFNMEKO_02242 [Culicoides impunctatus]
MSETISKKRHNDNLNSFEQLYQSGLTYIQQLSGHLWTDYNTHDLGITILEQVCYALTDLIYRCEFDVSDYLSDNAGNIDYRAQGLALPQAILPAYPQLSEEYEAWLLARLPELDKVWLRWSEDAPQLGIYTINAQLNHFYALSQQHSVSGNSPVATQQHAAIERIRSEFHCVRAVAEDLAAIELTGRYPLMLSATLHISDEVSDVTRLAASLYHRIAMGLESITQNTSVQMIKESLLAEEGVQQVDKLQFTQCSDDAGDSEWLPLDEIVPFSYLRLPALSTTAGIKIIQFQHPIEIDYADLVIQIEQIQYQRRAAQLSSVTPPALPAGRYFAFSRYESIQTLFPRNYHLAPGMPNHYHAQQQGQRHQLRSYLLLFDQLMANFCDDIAGLKNLFSLSLTPEATYHHRRLQDDEFYNINQHYPPDADNRLDQLRARFDDYPERKNRIFSYLLALYGERFPESLHRQFNPYFSASGIEKQLLKYKQAIILNIATVTRGRGIGDNLLFAEHKGGYHQRLSLLLGLLPRMTSADAEIVHLPRVVEDTVYLTSQAGREVMRSLNADNVAQLQPVSGYRQHQNLDAQYARQCLLSLTLFSEQILPERLLRFGTDNRRYRLLHLVKYDDYQLLFSVADDDSQQWFHIASHYDRQKITEICHQLQRCLLLLNQHSEKLYVVEPILLRSKAHAGSLCDTANRVTVVLPGYTVRFANLMFREQTRQLIIANSPAHLLIECLWLDLSCFAQFETQYRAWRLAKSAALQHSEKQAECDAIAERLSRLIQPAGDENQQVIP